MSTPTSNGIGPLMRFRNFWFAPGDPTTLGFIRIITGLLVLYVHLAYTFDLYVFFGPNGWYNLENINRERREAPYLYPALGWEDDQTLRSASLPEYPHRKKAVMDYYRDVVRVYPTRAELDAVLAYMDRLQLTHNPLATRDGLGYVLKLSVDPMIRKDQLLRVVSEDAAVNDPTPIPEFVKEYSPADRRKIAEEIERFYQSLPKDADGDARRYVIAHLATLDYAGRAGVLNFLRDLTVVSAEERKERLDYLEYWSFERRRADRFGSMIFSLWFHVTDPVEMGIAHAVILFIIVLYTAGLFTRVTSVLTWLAAVSYIHRTQQILFGMDTMMNILLFYTMIGNSGAALSLDRVINRYRAVRASLRRSGTVDAATLAYLQQPPPSAGAAFGLRLIQVHFCFIYMAAGLSKLKGAAWWSTNAYWDTLANPEFTLIHYSWYESLLREVTANRFVYSLVAAMGVGYTFFCEIGLPFLIWTRLRWFMLICGSLLHAGVAVFMGLWIFSLMMMALLLAYLPGVAIRERLFPGDSKSKVERKQIRFDPASAAETRAAARAKAWDFSNRVDLVPVPKRPA